MSLQPQQPQPECVPVAADLAEPLGHFFNRLIAAGVDQTFHPHAFTMERATEIANFRGLDRYFVMLEGKEIIGYGMLRGFDEGYDIPSLGIAIDPRFQGKGYGRTLARFLHDVARALGAKKIRLKVYRENRAAVILYQSLGYQFEDLGETEIIGFLDLHS